MKAMTMLIVVALASLSSIGCSQKSGQADKVYDIKGKVVSVDVAKKSVTLDHEDIPGLMPGMEMAFDVSDAKLLEGIKAGDQAHGKLTVRSGTNLITELKKQ